MKLSATRAQIALPTRAAQSACRDLIRRSIDLRQMYRQAARVCEPGLRTVLDENGQVLDLLINDLREQAGTAGGQSCDHGSWRGTAKRQLSTWLTRAAARQDRAWLRTLAHQADGLLAAFEDTIAQLPAESARLLCRQLPRLRAIHQDLLCLVGGTS